MFLSCTVAATIKNHLPEFPITYHPDFLRPCSSWPNQLDSRLPEIGVGNIKIWLEEMTNDI